MSANFTETLLSRAGVWDAEVELAGSKSKGVETCTRVGGQWLVTDFQGEAMGAPYHGHGLTGFDPTRGKVVGVWADSMSPSIAQLEGDASADGRTTTCFSEGADMEGKPARFKHVTRILDAKRRSYSIAVVGPDGRETPQMSIAYVRRG